MNDRPLHEPTFLLLTALTAGPVPALVLAGLVCLGWRRAAAAFAAFVPLAYLGVALASGYTLLDGPYAAVTLYAWALEALALLMASGAPQGWRALRWRPGALLAVITVAVGPRHERWAVPAIA